MSITLAHNGQFTQIRSESGVIAADAVPTNGASVATTLRVNPGRKRNIAVYWTGTILTSARLNLALWLYDGVSDLWIKTTVLNNVDPKEVAHFSAFGTTNCYVTVDAVSGGAPEDLDIQAYSYDE